jgi:hypothetical protein
MISHFRNAKSSLALRSKKAIWDQNTANGTFREQKLDLSLSKKPVECSFVSTMPGLPLQLQHAKSAPPPLGAGTQTVAQQMVRGHTSHVTRHTSHVTRHTSHVSRHTSHVTLHTSHFTRHTSHVTRYPGCCRRLQSRRLLAKQPCLEKRRNRSSSRHTITRHFAAANAALFDPRSIFFVYGGGSSAAYAR